MALFDDSDIEFNYKVDCIGNYADAQQYLDTTSWCISLIAVELSLKTKSFQSLQGGTPVPETQVTSLPKTS